MDSLRKQKDFEEVYAKGRRTSGPLFNLKAVPTESEQSRVAFVISKKTAKKAVDRNLLRRRLKAIWQEQDFKPGFDIVVLVKAEALKADYTELKKELIRILERSQVV